MTEKTYFIILAIFCFTTCFSTAELNYNQDKHYKQTSIEREYFPEKIRPGDKPFTFNDEADGKTIISAIMPELKNSRLMTFNDFSSMDQEAIADEGYTFVLRGDFDRDGFADVAFVGKYKNSNNTNWDSFFAVLTMKGKKLIRKYYTELSTEKACLLYVLEYKPNIDAIMINSSLDSERCCFIYWEKGEWKIETCMSSLP